MGNCMDASAKVDVAQSSQNTSVYIKLVIRANQENFFFSSPFDPSSTTMPPKKIVEAEKKFTKAEFNNYTTYFEARLIAKFQKMMQEQERCNRDLEIARNTSLPSPHLILLPHASLMVPLLLQCNMPLPPLLISRLVKNRPPVKLMFLLAKFTQPNLLLQQPMFKYGILILSINSIFLSITTSLFLSLLHKKPMIFLFAIKSLFLLLNPHKPPITRPLNKYLTFQNSSFIKYCHHNPSYNHFLQPAYQQSCVFFPKPSSGFVYPENSIPPQDLPPTVQTLLQVTQDQQLAIQVQLNALRNLTSSQKQAYVPPHLWKNLTDIGGTQGDFEVEQEQRDPLLSTSTIHQLFKDFQAASHSDQKLTIPEFSGEHNGDVCMDWLLQVEAIFDYKQFKDLKRVQLTETKLRKGAMHWWRNLQTSRDRAGLPRISTWAEMRDELEHRYISTNYRNDLSERIVEFAQGSLSVSDYSDEFHTLSSRAEVSEPEYITVGRYKRGFRKLIKDIMRLSTISTMSEAFQAALNAEALLQVGGTSTMNLLTNRPPNQTSVTPAATIASTTTARSSKQPPRKRISHCGVGVFGQSKFNSRSNLSSAPSTLTVSSYSTHSAGSLPTPRSEGEILASPNLKPFTFSELRNATRNFRPDSLLGEGGFGYVFKGWIDEQSLAAARPGSGIVIAVKKLKPEGFQGHKEWLTEVNYLGQLHHPNLVKLIGYCLEGDNRLLVYEFMPKGSLENHLFRRGAQPLPWEIRIKVAVGAARGLFFLHDAQVIYRDFKASNILLDSEFNAKLSDFGLAKDGPTGDRTHVSTQVMGTHGYAAPEYVATGRLSARSDVYSYGVVLLELLSGRRAVDKSKIGTEQNLVDWAKPYLGDKRKLFRVMDSKLEGQYPQKGAYLAASLALQCISSEAKTRPLMSEVLATLEQLLAPKNASKHSHSDKKASSHHVTKSPMRHHHSPLYGTPGGGASPLLSHKRSPRVH